MLSPVSLQGRRAHRPGPPWCPLFSRHCEGLLLLSAIPQSPSKHVLADTPEPPVLSWAGLPPGQSRLSFGRPTSALIHREARQSAAGGHAAQTMALASASALGVPGLSQLCSEENGDSYGERWSVGPQDERP